MTTPQSPQGGWTPGPQNFPNQFPGWNPETSQSPGIDHPALGIDPQTAAAQENELEEERSELSKHNAVRWIKISTAILASVSVVIGMMWGWQQLFWLELFTDPNSYIETVDGKELINDDLLDLINRDSHSDSETQNSTGSTVGGVGSDDTTETSTEVAPS